MTTAQLYVPLLAIETSDQANDFITERIIALRESGDDRSNEELDALERAAVIHWFEVNNLYAADRITRLFRRPESPEAS